MKKPKKIHLIICGSAIIIFFLYIAFFSTNNFARHRELNRQISDLESKIEKAKNHINQQYDFDEMKKNPELLEKFAREELNLQKKGEDQFIIVQK